MTIGTHRVTLGGQEKDILWSAAKDSWLRTHRGIGFEQVAEIISAQRHLAIVDHWNAIRYPNQRVFIVNVDDYGVYVPFVEAESSIFLKTIIRSRKATKLYLREN